MTTEYLGIKQVSERLGVANAASYDIESITLGTSQGAQSAANVAVAFNAVASCSVDRVKLVVRP